MKRPLIAGLLLLLSTHTFANEFSLLFYTAPNKLDWSSPGKLTRSVVANSIFPKIRIVENGESKYVQYPHAISHVNIKIHCQGEDPIYTGMTSDQGNGEYLKELLFKGGSLETMVKNVPGRLYSTEEVELFLPAMKRKGQMHEMRYLINGKTCERLKRYLAEYQAYDQDQIYGGLASVPWRFQGGGCAAFAMSALKEIGLYNSHYDKVWKRNLLIPERYMKLEDAPAERGFYSFVLHRFNGDWAKKDEAHFPINFWDPQRMYDWVQSVVYTQHTNSLKFLGLTQKLVDQKSLILVFDKRNHIPPSQSIWENE